MNKYLTRLITHILVEDEAARDDWMDTIRQVHLKELSLWCYPVEQYFDVLFSKKLSNVHTIRRLWQLVQEKNPELRGKTWEERQSMGGMVAQEFIDDKYFQLELFSDDKLELPDAKQDHNEGENQIGKTP